MTEQSNEYLDRLVGAMDVPQDLPLGGSHWGTWNAGPTRGDQWQKAVAKTAEKVARSRVPLVRKVAEDTRPSTGYGADNTYLQAVLEMVCVEMAAKLVVPDEALSSAAWKRAGVFDNEGPQDATLCPACLEGDHHHCERADNEAPGAQPCLCSCWRTPQDAP